MKTSALQVATAAAAMRAVGTQAARTPANVRMTTLATASAAGNGKVEGHRAACTSNINSRNEAGQQIRVDERSTEKVYSCALSGKRKVSKECTVCSWCLFSHPCLIFRAHMFISAAVLIISMSILMAVFMESHYVLNYGPRKIQSADFPPLFALSSFCLCSKPFPFFPRLTHFCLVSIGEIISDPISDS